MLTPLLASLTRQVRIQGYLTYTRNDRQVMKGYVWLEGRDRGVAGDNTNITACCRRKPRRFPEKVQNVFY
jgi:hypothetical protein